MNTFIICVKSLMSLYDARTFLPSTTSSYGFIFTISSLPSFSFVTITSRIPTRCFFSFPFSGGQTGPASLLADIYHLLYDLLKTDKTRNFLSFCKLIIVVPLWIFVVGSCPSSLLVSSLEEPLVHFLIFVGTSYTYFPLFHFHLFQCFNGRFRTLS